jgi:hypothetical protein
MTMDDFDPTSIIEQAPQAGVWTTILVLIVRFGWPLARTFLGKRKLDLMRTVARQCINWADSLAGRGELLTGDKLEDAAVAQWRKRAPAWLRKIPEDDIRDLIREVFQDMKREAAAMLKDVGPMIDDAVRKMNEEINRAKAKAGGG